MTADVARAQVGLARRGGPTRTGQPQPLASVSGDDVEIVPTSPGVVLPVNPSTLRVLKHLQKFDPSATRQRPVSDPSGSRQRAVRSYPRT